MRFPSQCNVVIGNVLVPEVNLVGADFISWWNIVAGNALLLVLKGMLIFPSLCTEFDGNAFMLKGKPLCNVVVSNALVLVLEGKIASINFLLNAMLSLIIFLILFYKEI